MGQINSLPSIILPTHKPFEVKPKKDSAKQKQQRSPRQEKQDAQQDNSPDNKSPHVDVKA
jgi:hypothetical protein